jgi:phosphatidylserine decarboxylase
MITRYGYDNAFLMIGFGLVLLGLGIFLFKGFWSVLFSILGAVTILFTLWFFRDPSRTIPQKALNDDATILAPADGKIVQIIPVEEKDYLQSSAMQISIFLSPLDVHVNRTPVTGIVEFYKYMPGDYLVAWHPKSSELNEQSRIGVRTSKAKVLFKQITGVLARRIVCEVKEGDSLTIGEKNRHDEIWFTYGYYCSSFNGYSCKSRRPSCWW